MNPASRLIQFVDTFQLETNTLPTGAIIADAIRVSNSAELLAGAVGAGLLMVNPLNLTYAVTARGCDHLAYITKFQTKGFLRKSEPSRPTPFYTRRVEYRPMGITSIENETGWKTFDMRKATESSRQRLHAVIHAKPRVGGVISGSGTHYYLFK
jgi:hypothetical protein